MNELIWLPIFFGSLAFCVAKAAQWIHKGHQRELKEARKVYELVDAAIRHETERQRAQAVSAVRESQARELARDVEQLEHDLRIERDPWARVLSPSNRSVLVANGPELPRPPPTLVPGPGRKVRS